MIHQDLSQKIRNKHRELAEAITRHQFDIQSGLAERYGDEMMWEKSVRDTAYHLSYLADAIAARRIALFVDYASWVKSVLQKYNVPQEDLEMSFQSIGDVLEEMLSDEMNEILSEYLGAGLGQLQQSSDEIVTFIDKTAPHGELAAAYLDTLLASNRHAASKLILDAVPDTLSVRDVYLHVFQPVLYEIGRLWQTNQISVAHEHFATSVTQLTMSQLYPHIFNMEKKGSRLVATCVGGELHEIGIRMVADFFEMAGWDTFYLGANTPAQSIITMIKEQKADMLAVSATMTHHIQEVRELIGVVRDSEVSDVKIMVGGYPFNVSPDLWQEIGADGYAPNAESSIEIAGKIVAN